VLVTLVRVALLHLLELALREVLHLVQKLLVTELELFKFPLHLSFLCVESFSGVPFGIKV
jgi:hypothetical protein